MTEELLKVEGLKKFFPIRGGVLGRVVANVHAVNDVSFTMRQGETLGLVGESGCGKSTLGRTVLRLHEPTAGKIHFDGEDITSLSKTGLREKRRQMQIVFQDPFSSLNPRMSVRKIIEEPFRIHKIAGDAEIKKEVEELAGIVGLRKGALDRFPHEFSGGQRQRIGIARALALRPKLIVADEPVSALDVSIQSQILNLMVNLRRQFGLSYLFISHDLAVIEHISDAVAVMYLGKIVEYSGSSELYQHPLHPYTRALIESIPKPVVGKRVRQPIAGDVPSPISPPSGCYFHPRCPMATDICRNEAPPLREKAKGQDGRSHLVACHHV